MMIRFFLVRGSEARSTQTTSSRTWTTGQLGGRTGTLCSIWTEVTVLILAFFFSDFVKSGYYNDADKVLIGPIISWTRQSLSTATLMSSTSSRCTTPLLTSGGDSFERSLESFPSASSSLRPRTEWGSQQKDTMLTESRFQLWYCVLGGRYIFFRSREVFQL